jgi:hypothetical protein
MRSARSSRNRCAGEAISRARHKCRRCSAGPRLVVRFVGRIDEPDVREGLREVPDQPPSRRVVLLGEEPEVVAQVEDPLEQPPGPGPACARARAARDVSSRVARACTYSPNRHPYRVVPPRAYCESGPLPGERHVAKQVEITELTFDRLANQSLTHVSGATPFSRRGRPLSVLGATSGRERRRGR